MTVAHCPSGEGPLRIGRMGIAISRRESAANLGARLPYSDRLYALRQTRARAAQAPDFWCPGSGGGARGGPEEAFTLGVLMNKFVGCEAEATWDTFREAAHPK